jgi:hypothetical protein
MTSTLAPLVLPTGRDAADVPAPRSLTAHVTGGLDGALRVLAMLRGRAYRVRDLDLEVREAGPSRVTCTVVVTAPDLDLLLARLQRMPAVVSAGSA